MRIHYSPDVDTLYIRFKETDIEDTDEINENLIIDYDRDGNVVGLEILCAAKSTEMHKLILDKELSSKVVIA